MSSSMPHLQLVRTASVDIWAVLHPAEDVRIGLIREDPDYPTVWQVRMDDQWHYGIPGGYTKGEAMDVAWEYHQSVHESDEIVHWEIRL